MTDTFKMLAQAAVGTGTTTVYTVPASTSAIIKHISISNVNAANRTVKIWQGGSADANVILPTTTLGGGYSGDFGGGDVITMAAADTIQATASNASSIEITVHGMEIS